jgi:hypothetical protein
MEFLQNAATAGRDFGEWLNAWLTNRDNWGGFFTTAMSAGFAFLSYLLQQGARKDQARAEQRLRLMQEEELRASLDRQVIDWGAEVINALTDAERVARTRTHPSFGEAREHLMSRLSALVDRGRLFFPNVSHDLVGLDRPFANRGFRPPILDAIMLVHERVRRLDPAGGADLVQADGGQLFEARRAFVSELQRALDPRRRKVLLENLADSSRSQSLSDDVVWDSVDHLVTRFEEQFGEKSFWRDPPKPRHLLVEAPASKAQAVFAGRKLGRRTKSGPAPEEAEA